VILYNVELNDFMIKDMFVRKVAIYKII